MNWKFFSLLLAILMLMSLLACSSSNSTGTEEQITWVSIDVSKGGQAQGDAHLIQVPNGKTVMIDVGYQPQKDNVFAVLNAKGVKKIDKIFITHAHWDHYGNLEALLKSDIEIGEVYFHVPNDEQIERESFGASVEEIRQIEKAMSEKGKTLIRSQAGDIFDLGSGVILKTIFAHDGFSAPIGETDLNDMSLIMQLKVGTTKVMFAGDLNRTVSQYLIENIEEEDLQADILKAPHHGVEGLAENAFFLKVNPKHIVIPAPEALWLSERGSRLRTLSKENGWETLANGSVGDIEIQFQENTYTIKTEKN